MHSGAAAAAIAQAIKASGAIVRMKPEDFQKIVHRADDPLVVMSISKIFGKVRYKYILSYKGLAFYTKSPSQLPMGISVELVHAKQIWIPA